MSQHLDDDALRGFAERSLSPNDLLDVDDHLAGCETCRARAARIGAAGAALEALTESMTPPLVHLTDEDVQLFADRRLPPDQAFACRRHLAECDVCRRQIDELSAWTRAPRRVPRPALAVAAAAAVLVIGVLSARVWRSDRAPAEVTVASDALRSLSPAARARVDAALRDGAAELPKLMTDLAPPRETLMGKATSAPAFEIREPAGTALVEDMPTFVWQPLANAAGYVVTILDESGAEAARSPTVSETRWTAARPLARDRTYTWQVSAERNGRTLIAPAPPDPPARFHVIDAATAAEVQRIAREYPDAHLVLGILYMECGVRAEAMSQLERVRPDDPYAEVARKSLDRLRVSQVPPPR